MEIKKKEFDTWTCGLFMYTSTSLLEKIYYISNVGKGFIDTRKWHEEKASEDEFACWTDGV